MKADAEQQQATRQAGSGILATLVCLALACGWMLIGISRQFAHVNYTTQDRGRDLYAALQVSQGRLPYKDFDWPYGPLGPVYYGVSLRLLGPTMRSFESAEMLLIFLGGVAVFLLSTAFSKGGAGGLLGLLIWWILVPIHHESHTGNHHLGTIPVCLVLWFQLRLLRSRMTGRGNLLGMAVGLLLLSLVKLNMGIAFGLGAAAVLALRWPSADSKEPTVCLRDLLVPAALLAGGCVLFYGPLIALTPASSIGRCLPFLGSHHHDYGSVWQRLAVDLKELGLRTASGKILSLAAFTAMQLRSLTYALGLVLCLAVIGGEFALSRQNRQYVRVGGILLAALLAGGHELFLSGAWYSTAYWASPAVAAVLPLGLGLLEDVEARAARIARVSAIGVGILAALIALQQTGIYLKQGTWEEVYHPRGGVLHLRLPDEETGWAMTVSGAAQRIESLAGSGKPILVVPFDPVYLFLSARPQVCRTVDFSGYQGITQAEEREIIQAMEQEAVQLVVWTNNATGLTGEQFGAEHCPALGAHIRSRFYPGSSFGPADEPGKSHSFHGARMWIRK